VNQKDYQESSSLHDRHHYHGDPASAAGVASDVIGDVINTAVCAQSGAESSDDTYDTVVDVSTQLRRRFDDSQVLPI